MNIIVVQPILNWVHINLLSRRKRLRPETSGDGKPVFLALEQWVLASWIRFFFIFCQIFGWFEDFLKWSMITMNALQTFENSSNRYMPCWTWFLKPIFRLISGTQKFDFGYLSDPSLSKSKTLYRITLFLRWHFSFLAIFLIHSEGPNSEKKCNLGKPHIDI